MSYYSHNLGFHPHQAPPSPHSSSPACAAAPQQFQMSQKHSDQASFMFTNQKHQTSTAYPSPIFSLFDLAVGHGPFSSSVTAASASSPRFHPSSKQSAPIPCPTPRTDIGESDIEDIDDDNNSFFDHEPTPAIISGVPAGNTAANSRVSSQITIATVSEILTPDSARQSTIPAFAGGAAANAAAKAAAASSATGSSTTAAATRSSVATTAASSRISGPRGPHLFCPSSFSPNRSSDAIEMSPISPHSHSGLRLPSTISAAGAGSHMSFASLSTPIATPHPPMPFSQSIMSSSSPAPARTLTPPRSTSPDIATVKSWSSSDVCHWMTLLNFEDTIVDRFQLHDITGAVLLDLKFGDLRELGIRSFTRRHQIWAHICAIRGVDPHLPASATPEDLSSATPNNVKSFVWPPSASAASSMPTSPVSPSRTAYHNDEPVSPRSHITHHRRASSTAVGSIESSAKPTIAGINTAIPAVNATTATATSPTANGAAFRANRQIHSEILPDDSASIVAIEAVLPKPHTCARGERCSKWRRQQRLLRALREHGIEVDAVTGTPALPRLQTRFGSSPGAGGPVDRFSLPASPSNPAGQNLAPRSASEICPSVVASSGVFGAGQMPQLALQEQILRHIAERDAQDNVKHFLAMQHVEAPSPVDISSDDLSDGGLPTDPLREQEAQQQQQQQQAQRAQPMQQHRPQMHVQVPEQQPQMRQQRLSQEEQFRIESQAVSRSGTISTTHTMAAAIETAKATTLARLEIPHVDVNAESPVLPRSGVTPGSFPRAYYSLGMRTQEMSPPPMVSPSSAAFDRAIHQAMMAFPHRRGGNVLSPMAEVDEGSEGEVSTDSRSSFSPADSSASSPELTSPVVKLSDATVGGSSSSSSANKDGKDSRTTSGGAAGTPATPAAATTFVPMRRAMTPPGTDPRADYPGVRHFGWVKKSKNKFLWREWEERHMRLRDGTISLHPNALPSANPIEALNLDDYTVTCRGKGTGPGSSGQSAARLAHRLRALRLTGGGDSMTPTSAGGKLSSPAPMADFPFQLVNTAAKTGPSARIQRALNLSAGKSHNFSVQSSNERIEWLREIMLEKAIRERAREAAAAAEKQGAGGRY